MTRPLRSRCIPRRTAKRLLFSVVVIVVLALHVAGAARVAGAADVSTITHGARVRLESHLAEGKLTLFDFYADWCSGCRQIAPAISNLAAAHGDELAVRKIDIVSWGSPVASQFGLRSIPHLKLYDETGHKLSEGDPGRVLSVLQRRLGGSEAAASGDADRLLASGGTGGGLATFVIVAIVIVLGGIIIGSMRRRRDEGEGGELPGAEPAPRHHDLSGGDPDALPIWFAMISGSLEGPFSMHELRDLERRGGILAGDRVRRKGDSAWRQLRELL